MGEEGFVKVEKDLNGGDVELKLEKEGDGSDTVVKEESAGVELFAEEEKEEGEEGRLVAEEKDCVEGADAREEENREDVWDDIGEDGVGKEEEEKRELDEDKDVGLGCLNVNVESVEGMAV